MSGRAIARIANRVPGTDNTLRNVYKNAPHNMDARVNGDLAALLASLPRSGG